MCSASVKPRKKSGPEKEMKDKEVLECIICSKTFKFNCLLENHIRRLHLREKPFACSTCKKCFPTKENLNKHKVTHRSSRFGCSKCSVTCKSSVLLKRHTLIVHDKKNLKFKCPRPGCNQLFISPSLLKRHLRSHLDIVSRMEFGCAECNMMWESKEGYQRHMKVHHNPERPANQCEFCKRFFGSEELLHQHKIEKGHDKRKLYNCGYCRREFSERFMLQRHRTRPLHLQFVEEDNKLNNLEGFQRTLVQLDLKLDPVLPCNACESSYNTEEDLAQHKELLHNNEPPKGTIYKCEEDGCDRVFERKSNRTRHINNFHNKRMRGFGCKKCGRQLKSKKGLVTHKCGELKGKRQNPERKSNKNVPDRVNKALQLEKPTRSQPSRTSARLKSRG